MLIGTFKMQHFYFHLFGWWVIMVNSILREAWTNARGILDWVMLKFHIGFQACFTTFSTYWSRFSDGMSNTKLLPRLGKRRNNMFSLHYPSEEAVQESTSKTHKTVWMHSIICLRMALLTVYILLWSGSWFLYPARQKVAGYYVLSSEYFYILSVYPSVRPTDFLQTLHGYWYRGGVVWDCKWAKFAYKQ